MLFGKMRETIAAYQAAAATLDPRVYETLLAMLAGDGKSSARRVARLDRQTAVALVLFELERDHGLTAAELNKTVDRIRERERSLGVAEEELDGLVGLRLRQQLDEQGVVV